MSKSPAKERVDVLLVERGLAETREKAKAAIMAGLVFLHQERIEKPGIKIDVSETLVVKGQIHPYVSRGGLKLESALQRFGLEIHDRVVLDIGSSTGGFTDCALQHGAQHVIAIDVGTNQLDWKLRKDPRVTVLEKTNFRYFTSDQLPAGLSPDLAVCDVSFISLRLILPPAQSVLKPGSDVIALIKPQFEAGRQQLGKNGIIKDPEVHRNVLQKVTTEMALYTWQLVGLIVSPIRGGHGNLEFLAHWRLPSGSLERENKTTIPVAEQIIAALEEARILE